MTQRKNLIRITIIFIVTILLPTLFISNKRSDYSRASAQPTQEADYRTYSYGLGTDTTASYSRILALYRNGQKDSYICASLEQYGNRLYLDGHYAKALEAYIMAMDLVYETEDSQNLTVCFYNIGNIHVIFGDYERAAYYYEKVLGLSLSERNRNTQSLAARYLVMCYARIGDREKAQRAMGIVWQTPLSDPIIESYYSHYCHGLMEELAGHYDNALRLFAKTYDISVRHGLRIGMGAYPLSETGRILALQGDVDKAIAAQKKAMNIAKDEKAFDQFNDACIALDSLYRLKGETDSAHVYLNIHRQLSEEMLNTADFYAVRNKLIIYEENLRVRKINILEQKVNLLVAAIFVFLIVLATAAFYNHKMRKAYRMLTLKNRQLIAEQDQNRQLMMKAENKKPLSPQDNEQNERLLARILDIMDDTSIICDKDFSLQTLAKLTDSNTKYVSAAVSATPQGCFKALLNEYRIKEACRRLTSEKYDAYTIQAVAETVGYGAVNNFIVQFKRYTGMTPSLYRKNAKDEPDA